MAIDNTTEETPRSLKDRVLEAMLKAEFTIYNPPRRRSGFGFNEEVGILNFLKRKTGFGEDGRDVVVLQVLGYDNIFTRRLAVKCSEILRMENFSARYEVIEHNGTRTLSAYVMVCDKQFQR